MRIRTLSDRIRKIEGIHVKFVSAAFVFLLAIQVVFLSTGTDSFGQEASIESRIQQQVAAGTEAYGEKAYEESVTAFKAALALGTDEPSVAFNAACSSALGGNTDDAFGFLNRSFEMGYSDIRHLESDSDLESLHEDPRWSEMVQTLKKDSERVKQFWGSEAFETEFAENISVAEKAAGIAKLWSEVRFNFVNFHLVPDLNWDEVYMEYLPRALETGSTLEYYLVLQEMVATLKDGHTNVYLPRQLSSRVNSRPGFRTRLIEDKVIIVDVFDEPLGEQGIVVGTEVTHVGETPVKEYAEENVQPLMASSTQGDLITRTYGHFLLSGNVDEPVQLTLRNKDGDVKPAEVKRMDSRTASLLRKSDAPYHFEIVDNNIGYVRLNSFSTVKPVSDFDADFEDISSTDALIIDLRENGGGNSGFGWRILSFLTDKPFATTKWHMLQYSPTYRAWNRRPQSKHVSPGGMFGADASKHYEKPVFVLTSPRTFSAAEDFAAAFDMLQRGKIIGEPTGGSTGQPLMFQLPGGGRARVCTKHDSYADGTEFVGIGITPDIECAQTVEDLRAGIDTVLEAAIAEVKN